MPTKTKALKRTERPAERPDKGSLGKIQGAQAILKGFSLLDLIADAPKPMRFSELLQYSRMPKGTLHRILQALVDSRLVKMDDRTQAYLLGNRLFEMAHRVWSDFDLRGGADPELERLKTRASETTCLGILDGRDVLIIDQRDFIQPMRIGGGIGARVSAPASALGKALLAYRSPDFIHEFLFERTLDAHTPNTITSAAELERELVLVKARGYATEIEEQFMGVNSVAAPIVDHRGEALGAISITGPAFRLTPERLHALGRDVIEAARRTSGNVGETFMSISITDVPRQQSDASLSCAVPFNAFLGEAPHWLASSGALLWVDILAPAAHVTHIADKTTKTTPLSEVTGCIVPRRRGGYIAATQSGLRVLDLKTGALTPLATPAGMAGKRFNDAKCDAAGRLWAGTLALDAAPGQGSLYRLDIDGKLQEVASGFHICNGIGWSPDSSRFYIADSGARKIYRYDFDVASGRIGERKTLVSFTVDEGMPDGLAIDREGYIWCAMWDGWALRRISPSGKLDRLVTMPVPRPTNCAFGGPDLKTLFITSARIRLSASQLAAAPLSGSIFRMDVDVGGTPVGDFGG